MGRVALIALAGLAAVAASLLLAASLQSRPAPAPAAAPPAAGRSLPVGPPSQAAAPVAEPGPPATSPTETPPPAPAPFFDEAGEPSAELLRAALADAIADKLPGYKLSSEELDQLAAAAWRLREAQRALRALPASPEHREERRALREEIIRAGDDFAYVLEMTPGEFTALAQPEVGIDADSGDEEIPEPEYLDDLR